MDFTPILREHGLKSTPQRTAILSQIYSSGHIDIERLHAKVLENIRIPLGTLYRVLGELSGAGVLALISVNGLKTHYEIVKNEHAHFVCDSCGKIDDFEYDSTSLIKDKELGRYDIKTVKLTVHGVCLNCK
jgi:Fur family transcriptional regulator, peroxide stress response regulator